MKYQKHGSGNDYKKGNRTRGENRRGGWNPPKGEIPENLESNQQRSRDLSEMTNYYRELATTKEKQLKYNLPYLTRAFMAIADYITECEKNRTPATIAGCQLAGGIIRDAWSRISAGDMDYILYMYMDSHDIPPDAEGTLYHDPDSGEDVLLTRPSELQNRVLLQIQDQLERNCYTNRGNPAGSIFGLKARFNWSDTPDNSGATYNQTLVIADTKQARRAMAMLTGDPPRPDICE